jgi:hypothetical protein
LPISAAELAALTARYSGQSLRMKTLAGADYALAAAATRILDPLSQLH